MFEYSRSRYSHNSDPEPIPTPILTSDFSEKDPLAEPLYLILSCPSSYPLNGVIESARIRISASVFSAELTAILSCLSCLNLDPPNKCLLLSGRSRRKCRLHPKSLIPFNPQPWTSKHTTYHSLISPLWIPNWENLAPSSNKLRQIKTELPIWSTSIQQNRREEAVPACLRISHTRLTHSRTFF